MSKHLQEVNTTLWVPQTKIAVDECMVRFSGRSNATTTIPGKPIPTGFKIWVAADHGFFMVWCFHRPGRNNGPLGVLVPKELGGKTTGKTGNKTQAVVAHLISQLPKATYHLFLDNLFVSRTFLEYMRKLGHGVTGTCRPNSGIHKQLVELKAKDKGKTEMEWGTVISIPSESCLVAQVGWKDNAFVLAQSTVYDGHIMVDRLRKRPRETSSKAKAARQPFGDDHEKILPIPALYNDYNYEMGRVDVGDQLASSMPGARRQRRGGHQALEQWLLVTALVNCYRIHCEVTKANPPMKTLKHHKFREELAEAIVGRFGPLAKGRKLKRTREDPIEVVEPPSSHHFVHMGKKADCRACKGQSFGTKRQVLGERSGNFRQAGVRHESRWGCRECGINLCNNNKCFNSYHRIES